MEDVIRNCARRMIALE